MPGEKGVKAYADDIKKHGQEVTDYGEQYLDKWTLAKVVVAPGAFPDGEKLKAKITEIATSADTFLKNISDATKEIGDACVTVGKNYTDAEEDAKGKAKDFDTMVDSVEKELPGFKEDAATNDPVKDAVPPAEEPVVAEPEVYEPEAPEFEKPE